MSKSRVTHAWQYRGVAKFKDKKGNCRYCNREDDPYMVACDGPHDGIPYQGHFPCFKLKRPSRADQPVQQDFKLSSGEVVTVAMLKTYCPTCRWQMGRYWDGILSASAAQIGQPAAATSGSIPASPAPGVKGKGKRPADDAVPDANEPASTRVRRQRTIRRGDAIDLDAEEHAETHAPTAAGPSDEVTDPLILNARQRPWTRAEEDLVAKYISVALTDPEDANDRKRWEFVHAGLKSEDSHRTPASIAWRWSKQLRELYCLEDRRGRQGRTMATKPSRAVPAAEFATMKQYWESWE